MRRIENSKWFAACLVCLLLAPSSSVSETIKITSSNLKKFTQSSSTESYACYASTVKQIKIGKLSKLPLQISSTWKAVDLIKLRVQISTLKKQLVTQPGNNAGKFKLKKWTSFYNQLQRLVRSKCRASSSNPEPSPTSAPPDSPTDSPTPAPVPPAGGLVDTTCNPGTGTDYKVGDGQPYASLNSVPWGSLQPGDSVRLFYRAAPYKEKVFLTQSGTPQNPITFCGVLGPNGERPIIDGNGATTSSSLSLYAASTLEPLGVVLISISGTAPWLSSPSDMRVKNLEIRSGYTTYSFTDRLGALKPYKHGASALYIWRAKRIRITNVVLHDSGNGLFVNSGGGFGTQDITFEGSHVYGNGDPSSYLYHNAYTESDGMIYQFNRFGPLRAGSPGNNVKDRSSGSVFRYNWVIEGGHLIDLVEAQNNQGNAANANYQKTWVYGNTFINGLTSDGGATFLVHFGGDQGVPTYYRPTLNFYNNTVYTISNRQGVNSRWRTILFQVTSNSQTVNAWNNILYSIPATVGQTPSRFCLMLNNGQANFGANWVSPGWFSWSDGGVITGSIAGTSNFLSPAGNNPGFADSSFATFDPHLSVGSSAINQGGVALDAAASEYNVDSHYVMHQQSDIRPSDSLVDLGAFER